MSKHTPGPWVAREVNGAGWPGQRGWAIDYNSDQEQVVDYVYIEADANLIAAAPDLLEALQYARRFLRPGDQDTAYVDAAIAKAKGEKP